MSTDSADARLVLIVERDRNVRELQAHFLGSAGFTVAFADDGQTALDLVEQQVPRLVITEILVAKVDGLTLCRRLRDNPSTRDIPVIVFSILAAAGRAQEAGASAFLRKPLVGSVFLEVVSRAMRERSPHLMELQ